MNPNLFQSLDLKEGDSAYCSINEIQLLAQGANPAQVWVPKKAGELTWHLTRQSGILCVRCSTTPIEATKIANGQPAAVNMYGDGDTDVAITLPVNKFVDSSELQHGSDGSVIRVQVN